MLKNYRYNNILQFIKNNPNTNITIIKKHFKKYNNIETIIQNLATKKYITGFIIHNPLIGLVEASKLNITIEGEEILTSKIFRFFEKIRILWNWFHSFK